MYSILPRLQTVRICTTTLKANSQTLVQMAWEKLHTGNWKDVSLVGSLAGSHCPHVRLAALTL